MGCVYARYKTLWIKFKDHEGAWVYRKTEYRPGQEDLARKLLQRVEDKISAGVEVDDGVLTFAKVAKEWITQCQELGIGEWKNNESRLRIHVSPHIGEMPIDEVRPRHLAAIIQGLRSKKRWAPKTIHHIYGAIQGVFHLAHVRGYISENPCVLNRRELGPMMDKDPDWRKTAKFTREELCALIFDSRIPMDRRVRYALDALAGLRHGEMAGLRWSCYDADRKPLGLMNVRTSYDKGKTKTGAPREVPVHPILAHLLQKWRDEGWIEMMGRKPESGDLIVPCPERPTFEAGKMRDRHYSRKRLIEDLATLGFRHRRGHDLRRTMISLIRSDGARKDLLEWITHTPGSKSRTAIDDYTTFDWEALCTEMSKLKLEEGLPQSTGDGVGVEAEGDEPKEP